MRKIYLAFFACITSIALVILVTPLIFGFMVQKYYAQILQQFSMNIPEVSAKVVEFKRGWFNSSAKIRVTFISDQSEADLNQPYFSFIINSNIKHGPIIIAQQNNGHMKFSFGRALFTNRTNESQIQMTSQILWTINNHLRTHINVPLIQFSDNQKQLVLNNLSGTVTFQPNRAWLKTHFTITHGLFSFQKNIPQDQPAPIVNSIEFDNLKAGSKTSHDASILWYGNSQVHIGKIKLSPVEGLSTILSDFRLSTHQNKEGNKTKLTITNQIGTISNAQAKLDHMNLDLRVHHLSTPALADLSEAIEQNKSTYSSLFNLLSSGFVMTLKNLSFNTDQGPVALRAHLKLPFDQKKSINPLYWLSFAKQIDLAGQLRLPQAWLNEWLMTYYKEKQNVQPDQPIDPATASQQQIDFWIKNNILQKNNQNVEISILFKNGSLLINGAKPSVSQYLIN